MIAFVRGRLAYVSESAVVIDNQGIGYRVLVPASVLAGIPSIGEEIMLHTYMNVREDAMQLFGFLTQDDLEMFKLLITVNGIGPKGALGILSVMDTDTLRFAILADDAKMIAKTPGIGSKTASKLILELKDKCNLEDLVQPKESKSTTTGADHSMMNDAIQALVALGYSNSDALNAVKKVAMTEDMDVEDVLRASLKNL